MPYCEILSYLVVSRFFSYKGNSSHHHKALSFLLGAEIIFRACFRPHEFLLLRFEMPAEFVQHQLSAVLRPSSSSEDMMIIIKKRWLNKKHSENPKIFLHNKNSYFPIQEVTELIRHSVFNSQASDAVCSFKNIS